MKKKNKGYVKFWGGGNMVYHGRCANDKFVCFVMTLKLNECHATVNWNVWVLHKQLGTPGSMTPFGVLNTKKRKLLVDYHSRYYAIKARVLNYL